MDEKWGLLLRRERLRQNDRSGRFCGPLEELSRLGLSWINFRIVIITIDKERLLGFALILIINKLGFGSLRLRVIFILLILTLPFFKLVLSDRGRLNRVNLRGFVDGRSRRHRILNIRSIRLGVGGRVLNILRLIMESANHTISHMRSSRGS
jgi:hypothetical protein